MGIFGWSLVIVVIATAIICWPIVGALLYRVVQMVEGDGYNDAHALVCMLLGPITLILVVIFSLLRIFNLIINLTERSWFDPIFYLAGKPQEKKGESQ